MAHSDRDEELEAQVKRLEEAFRRITSPDVRAAVLDFVMALSGATRGHGDRFP